MKTYHAIARALGAMRRCENSNPINQEWADNHEAAISALCDELPSGSGFDNGSHIDLNASTPEKLVFTTAFHHMDEGGCYDGWTYHEVIITPSLEMGCHIKVTGRNRHDIKSYIQECFSNALEADCDEWAGYPKAEPAAAVAS